MQCHYLNCHSVVGLLQFEVDEVALMRDKKLVAMQLVTRRLVAGRLVARQLVVGLLGGWSLDDWPPCNLSLGCCTLGSSWLGSCVNFLLINISNQVLVERFL